MWRLCFPLYEVSHALAGKDDYRLEFLPCSQVAHMAEQHGVVAYEPHQHHAHGEQQNLWVFADERIPHGW
jgi:hypothetical protein